ncbi:flagellar biosynthesis anti-sigma factor FlgM [Desulfoluna spongiiphila]|uniref:Negative regulator of flagellin synthesis n=1 Tax=Desulfoluna spongiiphila TaxID=419481 RepID=A0A1G5IAE9_9BACT|nr:flagellar biosynthesis anti-sigma factor FlgM [Desulfoluna spongiiphila]SCY73062.1 anti-sigma-28 factor, FlgM family [Desulfoluna spongiiphila]VVS93142.1 anti-sigma-28 factor flgm [Desulfoluna spongiiphila]
MKISESNANYGRQLYMREVSEANPAKQGTQAKGQERSAADKVTLSRDSRDMQIARDAMMNTPDIRTEKVEELRNEVKEGRYAVPADKVADKIIASAINEYV